MATSISEEEIEREVRTLKNLRRRSATSSGPGALPVDPDLPPRDAFASESTSYSSNDDVTLSLDGDAGLFWVPAHLHPELAPGEFRQFLKQHTQVNPEAVDSNEAGEASLARSPSWLARSRSMSGSLGRSKSMLSKQYQPRHGDKVEEEESQPLPRRGSQRNGDVGLTLKDLQHLEEMVDDQEFGNDPEKMAQFLRRSLSRRVAGLDVDQGGTPPEEGDMPLVAPRPGSIIRRTARTKIRKGEGSRRFSSNRNRHGPTAQLKSPSTATLDSSQEDGDRRSDERRSDETSDERGSSEMAEAQYAQEPPIIETSHVSDDSNDEALIYDAYARDRTSSSTASSVRSSFDDHSRSSSPEPVNERPKLSPLTTPKAAEPSWRHEDEDELTPTQESPMSAALHAMNLMDASGPSDGDIFATPEAPPVHSPPNTHAPPPAELPPGMAPPARSSSVIAAAPVAPMPQRNAPIAFERPPLARTDSNTSNVSSSSQSSAPQLKEKQKEKKGGLFSKKSKDKEKSKKEKDGFLGSLFGSKKKAEEQSSVSNFASAGPAAAAALLGTSKSAKSLHHTSGTSSPTSPGFSNFARYPIHVERAVYRLSHIKLANARRPLIEQVLISNLMFWYLGVIGRATGPAEDQKPGTVNGLDKDRDESARQPQAKGTPPQPADAGPLPHSERHEKHVARVDTSPSRKTGLTKPERSRTQSNSETAFRAPQYGIQNAQVDHDIRSAKSPQATAPQQQHHHHQPQQAPYQPPARASVTPIRTRSPPAPTSSPPPRAEYPPGVAPPRPQSFVSPRPMPPSNGDPRPRTHSLPPPGAQPARPQGAPMRPQQPYPQQRHEPRPMYPQHQPHQPQHSPQHQPHAQHGPQPGQVFHHPGQYRPGPQPGQIFTTPQPGQIFHHPQFTPQQRPPPQQPGWEHQQRQQPRPTGPAMAQGPPRRSSQPQTDPYGRPLSYREGQTSPTHQSFYAAQRPPQQYYSGNGSARPQPVPSGQYPHHR